MQCLENLTPSQMVNYSIFNQFGHIKSFHFDMLWWVYSPSGFRLLPEESTALTIDLFSSYPPFNRLPLKAIKIYQKYQACANKSMHSTMQC